MLWAFLDKKIAGMEFDDEDVLFEAIEKAMVLVTPEYVKSLFVQWNKNL